ncbi:F-box protein skip16 [Coemansia sp. RSA 2599]|nr:F-box protein skip16 [Coemansia sp. RSA 2599]KAJ1808645.1 F-box protein skip16 [Coemansia sp. RSA 2598]
MQPQSFRFVDKGLFGQFFDSYVDALVQGHHDIHDGVISMMPNCGPYTSSSMSHGIRTTVSAMFCADETPRFRVYRYQVTFEIVDPEALGYSSVQLKERYWLIRYTEGKYTEVGGAGVVGEFPVISVDDPYYRYCSRVQDEMDDLLVEGFEGFFTMVPGSLDEPLGEDIILPVPFVEVPVPLEVL